MEWSVLFAGSSGAGKTEAIRVVSEAEVLEGRSTGHSGSTVSMDMGVMHLDNGQRMRLFGAPGNKRFEFMWDVLLQQARGLVVLIDHRLADPLGELGYYLEALGGQATRRPLPVVVGITHTDGHPHPVDLQPYQARIAQYLQSHPTHHPHGPVMALDARQAPQVKSLLQAMAELLEKGVNLKRVQLLMGHNSMKTTSIYLHLANTDQAILPNLACENE